MTEETLNTPLLRVTKLGLRHLSATGPATILQDVSFELERGEILGIIGESGAGKSTLGNAVLGLLAPEFHRTSGTIEFDGKSIDTMPVTERDAIRGRRISAIFQDHTASLDPLMSVGGQLEETILATDRSLSRRQARARALELLARVGIPEPPRRYRNYPHQFSGGQRQRVVIAIALAGAPDIIIADEPTSALDVTVQLDVLRIMDKLVSERGMGLIFVSHDLRLVSSFCDRVIVMYAGKIVEELKASELNNAQHPYTRGLLNCMPVIGENRHPLPVLDRKPEWAA